jgi:hypothetical protein
MPTLPSSEAEEMSESLKGDLQSISAVYPHSIPCATVPVGVENSSSVAAEERQLVGSSAALIDGNDCKGATTTGFPVDRDVFRVGLEGVSASMTRSRAVS